MTYSRFVQSDSVTPNTSDREEVQIDFVATSTAGERNYQAATERAVPFGAGGPSSQNNPGKTNIFQLAHYQQYFNVDTSVRSLHQPVLMQLHGTQCLLLACSSLHRSPVARRLRTRVCLATWQICWSQCRSIAFSNCVMLEHCSMCPCQAAALSMHKQAANTTGRPRRQSCNFRMTVPHHRLQAHHDLGASAGMNQCPFLPSNPVLPTFCRD